MSCMSEIAFRPPSRDNIMMRSDAAFGQSRVLSGVHLRLPPTAKAASPFSIARERPHGRREVRQSFSVSQNGDSAPRVLHALQAYFRWEASGRSQRQDAEVETRKLDDLVERSFRISSVIRCCPGTADFERSDSGLSAHGDRRHATVRKA